MRLKKNAIPMKLQSFKPVYMMYQKKERTCGCSSQETCGKCKVCALASLEAVIDGSIARYNPKTDSVTVQAAPRILYYRSGTPTGETVPGDKWRGSAAEFGRIYNLGFRALCAQGWAAAQETITNRKG